jgi:hypothetical protein
VCPGGNGELNWLDDTTMVVTAGGILNGTLIAKWMKIDTFGIATYSKFFSQAYILNSNNPCTLITFDKKVATFEGYNMLIYFYKLNQNFDFDSMYTHQYVYDSLCPHSIVSDTIDPNCDLIVSVDNSKTFPQSSKLKVYPNPATNSVNVEFPKVLVLRTGQGKNQGTKEYYQWKSTTFEVYDLEGKKVFQKEIPMVQQQLEMDISNWQRGLYFFRLIYDKQTVDGVKVIIK